LIVVEVIEKLEGIHVLKYGKVSTFEKLKDIHVLIGRDFSPAASSASITGL
jgi:hypothetical protein